MFIVVRLVLKKGGTMHYVGFVMTLFLSVVCYMGLNSSLCTFLILYNEYLCLIETNLSHVIAMSGANHGLALLMFNR